MSKLPTYSSSIKQKLEKTENDNPETLATLGIQATGQKLTQYRNTFIIPYYTIDSVKRNGLSSMF
jgi:hypothetical protein